MVSVYGCIDVIVKRSSMLDGGKKLIMDEKIKSPFYDDDLICIPGGMSPHDAECTAAYLERTYSIKIIDYTNEKHPFAKDGAIVNGPFGLATECNWLINSEGGWSLKKDNKVKVALSPWYSKLWKEKFDVASLNHDRDTLYALRAAVLKYNKAVVNNGGYYINGQFVPILDAQDSCSFQHEIFPESAGKYDTQFSVVNEDCLAVARELASENPIVLNMANRHTPGGGAEYGAGAQEECLFRSSNYYTTLYPIRDIAYPMDRDFGAIYSPNVTVFRGLEAEGYPLLEKPFKVSFMAVAALNRPHLTEDGDYLDVEREGMKNKIRTMFNVAIRFKHNVLILSAFGCGAFKNPPDKVAMLFKDILSEQLYKNAFKKVIFAIKKDHNDVNNENYQAFDKVFKN